MIMITISGTIGYHNIEKWSYPDSFYMTLITLSTVGFSEVHNLSINGKLFTSTLILLSIGFMAYFTATMAQIFIEGEILKLLGKRKLERKIKNMKGHYIICGFGRIGRVICKDLTLAKKNFVVIESNRETVEKEIIPKGYLHIPGDSTEDEILLTAGIKNAKGIITAVDSDVSNVFITLIARELNPRLFILSRASSETARKKLRRAGASKVVSPYELGGKRMVSALLRPFVTDFLETTTSFSQESLQIEEVEIDSRSVFLNQTLREANLRSKFGVIIVAIQKSSGEKIFNPDPSKKLELGDILIALGYLQNLTKMGKVF